MTHILDGTAVLQHGMFFMESAGGYQLENESAHEKDHQPSCFGLEEEKGEAWTGAGAARPLLVEIRPTL